MMKLLQILFLKKMINQLSENSIFSHLLIRQKMDYFYFILRPTFLFGQVADFRSMQQVYPIDVRLTHFMGKKPCHGHHLLDKKTIMLFRLFSRLGQFCLETLRQYFKLFIILLKVSFLSTTTSTMVAVKPTSFLASHAARYLNEKYVAIWRST